MLTTEAAVETGRASRYLVQLCKHLREAARTHPQMRAQVEWSDDHGVISLPFGRCTLDAGPDVLTLRAEAPDEESLHQLQSRIADRLEQVGRRDGLTVTWSPPRDADGSPTGEDSQTGDDDGLQQYELESGGIPRWVKVAGIVVAVAVLLAIVVMLVGGGHSPRRHGLPEPVAPSWTVESGGAA